MSQQKYTFGDNERAAARLELLARAFEPSLRAFVTRWAPPEVACAFDLGCGPGHTTRVLSELLDGTVVGVELSPAHLLRARASAGGHPKIRFLEGDVVQGPAQTGSADVVYSRFLLTHLRGPAEVLSRWARALRRGGRLLVQETAQLASEHPALAAYYAHVGRLQAHYGQVLEVGRELESLVVCPELCTLHFRIEPVELPAALMAELHSRNLATWREDPFARTAFDADELDRIAAGLEAVAAGREPATVRMALGELVAERT
jgi:SAM-dependent methyltransferase